MKSLFYHIANCRFHVDNDSREVTFNEEKRQSHTKNSDKSFNVKRLMNNLTNSTKMSNLTRQQIKNRIYAFCQFMNIEMLEKSTCNRSWNNLINDNDDFSKRFQNIKLSNMKHLYKVKNWTIYQTFIQAWKNNMKINKWFSNACLMIAKALLNFNERNLWNSTIHKNENCRIWTKFRNSLKDCLENLKWKKKINRSNFLRVHKKKKKMIINDINVLIKW